MANGRLEEAGKSLRRGIGGVPIRQVLEVVTPLRVGPCPYQRELPGPPLCSGLLPASWRPPSAIRETDFEEIGPVMETSLLAETDEFRKL